MKFTRQLYWHTIIVSSGLARLIPATYAGGAAHLQAFLTAHGTQYDQPGASLQPLPLSPGGEPGTWGLGPMGETA